jgi:class 3 adenylate cyclase/tRNA A-37 threonylcarbamoyl transferase component Bud32
VSLPARGRSLIARLPDRPNIVGRARPYNPSVADLVAERYELLEVLGQGGDSQVVQAVDRRHDRLVALKVRHVRLDEAREQLLAESRALLELEPHPALPVVRDDFFLDDRHVLVMDWIDGTNVDRIVRERGDPGLAVATVLGELPAVADALDHLHQQRPRIIHGDVRPENVIITPYGRARLVFGVAAVGSRTTGRDDAFCPPELMNGGEPGPASDVFGLAATIVYTLTGRPPGPGPVIEWEGVAPELAKRLDRVLRRALDPDPVRRPPTANDLLGRIVAARDSVLPVGVVTFALTDIEGSTDLWEAHPDVMADVIVRHYELAAEIAEAHGGRMPRSQGEGDSTLTAFARASDAVEGALAFQQAVLEEPWPEGIDLRVRTGLHTGEAQVEHGDYFGAAVSRAARLRALGRGGQVLVSQATAELVADRLPSGVSLRDLGQVQLRGFGRAETVHQLCAPFLPDRGDPVVLAGDAGHPSTRLPYPIAEPAGASRFVGRTGELAALATPWTRAVDTSQRRVVLVGGDPGIGKSRLTAEFARDVYANGATVLFGRCYEEDIVPYQPFVEAIEHYLRHGDASEVRADLVRSGTLLERFVPDIALRFPDLPEPIRAEPDTERYLMFEAVDALLAGIAKRSPLLLVLDDLHWAERPTLALLSHVARHAEAAPVVILGTYRDGDVVGDHPLRQITADLRHDGVLEQIRLGGMNDREVGELIEATSMLEASPGFVHSVRRETDGNPFFVQEICSHVGETGATAESFTLEALGVPEGVKQVISRRIGRLPEGTERLLTIGALIGREFDLDLLADVADDDEDTVLDALERACTARLVEEVSNTIGRYSFVHALTREALYDSIGATRRARLHRRVAEAIETRFADDLEEHYGALAFHYAAAGTDLPKAVEYAGRAGQQALARLAHEDAAKQFERGLELLAAQDRARCDLLLGLAEARRRAGDVPGSRVAFEDAGAIARHLGDAELVARAAIGSFRGHVMANPAWHDSTIRLLEEALELLPREDDTLRSRVLAALSLELYFTPQQARGITIAEEAIEMARRVGDDESLAFALACAHTALSDPGHLDDRLQIASELVGLSERAGNPELTYIGHVHRALDLLELARVDDARRSARTAAELVDELGQPMQRYYVTWLQSTLALLEGRFDEAQRLADEALEIGISVDNPDAFVVWGAQALVLGWQRGKVDHLVEPARQLLEQFPELTSWPAAVALVEALSGHHDAARERLRAITADLDSVDFSATWAPAMLALTEVCRIVYAPECAGPIYERLVPYAQTLCVVSLNLSEMGPVSRALGVLASLLGDDSRAEVHFTDALATSDRIGAPPHLARASVDFARMLLARGAPDDIERARALLMQARPIAERIGQHGVLAEIVDLDERAGV